MSTETNRIDGRALLSFVERVEGVRAEIADLKLDIKTIVSEAERAGFTAKGVAFCVKVRGQKPREFEENEQLRDLYLHAMGMAEVPPLFRQLDAFSGVELARNDLIERFKALVPTKGEITLKLESGAPVRLWRDQDGTAHAEEVKPPAPSPVAAPARGGASPAARSPAVEAPSVDADGAEALGRTAARENRPIIANPFPFGDPRRSRFDVGWRKETGNDGMGPDD